MTELVYACVCPLELCFAGNRHGPWQPMFRRRVKNKIKLCSGALPARLEFVLRMAGSPISMPSPLNQNRFCALIDNMARTASCERHRKMAGSSCSLIVTRIPGQLRMPITACPGHITPTLMRRVIRQSTTVMRTQLSF